MKDKFKKMVTAMPRSVMALLIILGIVVSVSGIHSIAKAAGFIDDATLWSNVKSQFISAGWTPPTTPPPSTQLDAWIYPEAPNVPAELADGRTIYALKAEFQHVNADGTISQINASAAQPNGYSASNVSLYKSKSTEQYITVSGDQVGTAPAMSSSATIPAIVNLVVSTGFTGAELDWEGYGQWTPAYYSQYKTFLSNLKSALAAQGKKLMVNGPAIPNATYQGYYQFKYEEVSPLVDTVVMMVYDYQYDYGVGTSIQPDAWAKNSMAWLKAKANNGIVGIPSYGYKGPTGSYTITVGNSTSMTQPSPVRNSDGELTQTVGSTFYDWSDKQTMQTRLLRVQNAGFTRLSVWSLGNNPWF